MFATSSAIRHRFVKRLTLPSAENFILADWAAGQGVTSGTLVATLPSGEIIGGTVQDGYAFELGDISGFTEVAVEVAGQIHGMGGSKGIAGGAAATPGSGGIHSDHPFTLNLWPAADIQAGGGGGGAGGLGAEGKDEASSITSYKYTGPQNTWAYWVKNNVDGSLACASQSPTDPNGISASSFGLAGTQGRPIGYPCGYEAISISSGTNFWRAGAAQGLVNIKAYGGGKNQLFQSVYVTVGYGESFPGNGGDGEGYNQINTSGESPGSSTYRAGAGGIGGNGGLMGIAGSDGSPGGSGLTYSLHGPSHATPTYTRMSLNAVSTDYESGKPGANPGINIDVHPDTIINYL